MGIMKSIQIIIIFLCILFYGCEKEPDSTVKPPNNQKDTSFVDEILKQNYLFNPGSKWIYKSERSEFDTVRLISLQQLFMGPMWVHGIQQGGVIEYYQAYYKSNTKDSFVDFYEYYSIMRNPTSLDWSGYHGNYIFLSWFKPGDSIRGTKLLEIIDSLTFFGETYRNVAKVQKLKDENENYYDTYYYFAPHFGIIRKEIKDSITWNLYESDIK
jgi:hypothetical protein